VVSEHDARREVPAAESSPKRWARWLLVACVLVGAIAGIALRCSDRPSATASRTLESTTPREPPTAVPPAAPAVVVRARDAGVGASAALRAADSAPQPGSVASLARRGDDADRALLAELERLTRGEPPPAVHALIAARRAGATRADLERMIAAQLARPIALRLAAMRWLNAIAPGPAAPPASGAVPPPFGEGGGPRRLQPIAPRAPSSP
jgi:hypothetical protein